MSDDADEPKVSATIILDQIALLKELHGEEVVRVARSELPDALRAELDALLPGRWCSLDAAREFKARVALAIGESALGLQRRIVRAGVERTFTTIWRFVLRQLSDDGLAKRSPLIYSRTFSRGSLELVASRPGEADFELRGWPRIPDYELVGLMTGLETVLALAGRIDARVVPSRRANVVRLHATWRGA